MPGVVFRLVGGAMGPVSNMICGQINWEFPTESTATYALYSWVKHEKMSPEFQEEQKMRRLTLVN